MPTVNQSVEILAPPDRVWAVVGDLSRYGEWNVTHSGFPDGTPQLEPGAAFKERVTIMGMPSEASWRIVELEAPKRLVLDGDGPMGVKLGQRLELAGNGEATTVRMEASFDGGPLAGPTGDAVAKSAEKAGVESLEKLRALVG